MKYKINGKEIKLLDWKLGTYYTEKINELIQALGEPAEEKKKWDRRELKDGDEYWTINDYGSILSTKYYSTSGCSIWEKKSGNAFETREEAEAYKQKLIEDNK